MDKLGQSVGHKREDSLLILGNVISTEARLNLCVVLPLVNYTFCIIYYIFVVDVSYFCLQVSC